MKTPFRLARFLFALAGCALVGCAAAPDDDDNSESADKIVGGTLVTSAAFDAVVSLTTQYEGSAFSFCSGTLIAPDIVLTAEHCIEDHDLESEPIEVRVGEAVDEPKASEMVAEIIAVEGEPQHGIMGYGSDVAFLRLRAPIEGVTPIPMLNRALRAEDRGKSLLAVGFGRTTAAADGSDNPKGTTKEPHKRYAAPELVIQVSGEPAWASESYARIERWLAAHGYPSMDELAEEQERMNTEEAAANDTKDEGSNETEGESSGAMEEGAGQHDGTHFGEEGKRLRDQVLYDDYEAVVEDKGAGYTCQGDSGGPHLLEINGKYVVAGVTSGGPGLGRVGCLPGLTYIGTFGSRVQSTREAFVSH